MSLHCENCAHWKQPVTPETCYADDVEHMGDCKHENMPIAKSTHRFDWCDQIIALASLTEASE